MKTKPAFAAVLLGLFVCGCTSKPTPPPDGSVTPEQGGVAVSPDGKLTVTVPPGAVDSPVTITLAELPKADWPSDVPGLYPVGSVYRAEPSGLSFSSPVEVTVTLAEEDLLPLGLDGGLEPVLGLVSRAEDGTISALEETLSFLDPDAGTTVVTGKARHFSSFITADGLVRIEMDPRKVLALVNEPWEQRIRVHTSTNNAPYTCLPFICPNVCYRDVCTRYLDEVGIFAGTTEAEAPVKVARLFTGDWQKYWRPMVEPPGMVIERTGQLVCQAEGTGTWSAHFTARVTRLGPEDDKPKLVGDYTRDVVGRARCSLPINVPVVTSVKDDKGGNRTAARPGQVVIISGQSLGGAGAVVRFNGVVAAFQAGFVPSETELRVIVPATATSGPLTLEANGQTITVNPSFVVITPCGPQACPMERLPLGTTADVHAVVKLGTSFIALTSDGKLVRSTDGVVWTVDAAPGENLTSASALQTKYYATISGSSELAVSTDAQTWTRTQVNAAAPPLTRVVGHGSRLFALGGPRLFWTLDGTSWTPATTPSASGVVLGTATGSNGGVNAIHAVGHDGTAARVWRSTDNGSTFVDVPSAAAASAQQLNAAKGNGPTVVAVGNSGTILRSADGGQTWTAVTSGVTADLHAVTYTGSVWLAVGASGTVLTSADGTSWHAETVTPAATLTWLLTDSVLSRGFVGASGGQLFTFDRY